MVIMHIFRHIHFFVPFVVSQKNIEMLKQFLEVNELTQNELIALTVSIAKHHGNLPDFTPADYNGTGASYFIKE